MHAEAATGSFQQKKNVFFKKLQKFTGKHLCWSLLFNKVAGLRLATLLERDCDTGVSCELAKFLRLPSDSVWT